VPHKKRAAPRMAAQVVIAPRGGTEIGGRSRMGAITCLLSNFSDRLYQDEP
jgi:hypothetical protein